MKNIKYFICSILFLGNCGCAHFPETPERSKLFIPQSKWQECSEYKVWYIPLKKAPSDSESVKIGDEVTIHYVGAFNNRHIFDSSRDRQVPFTFTIGKNEVIPGIEKGMIDMKVGEIRLFYIPADLSFKNTLGPAHSLNSVYYEIELLKIKRDS